MARLGTSAAATASVRPMPTVVNMPPSHCAGSSIISSPVSVSRGRRNRAGGRNGDGISFCGLCICCTCIHLEFLKRAPGIFKLAEAILGLTCQFLLVQFGSGYAPDLGDSYVEFLVSVSSCVMTTVLLLTCYLLSKNSYHLIRSSIFEVAFNLVASFLYITSSSYLAFALNTRLVHRVSHFTLLYSVSSVTAAYTLGLVAGIVHGIDGYMSYRSSSSGFC